MVTRALGLDTVVMAELHLLPPVALLMVLSLHRLISEVEAVLEEVLQEEGQEEEQ
jgi:hypothetical protein